ncbi:tubulin/FtsZ family protein [Haloglomus litoreum]|uniref:tubulin/FtsZ family protein n=1 Tax=Haloglomus litoreum TaxID=3034026 RepID=UPI0023E86FA2|nr:tubulin/FtsZ family protein [Haloglomus sp. DT116]
MKLAVVGFGNAGGKVLDELLAFEDDTGRAMVSAALAINSAKVDLARLERVPDSYRVLVGQADGRVKGHGVGSDPDLGASITEADMHEIDRALDQVPLYEIDAFLVIAGLGGGTGSGGAPKLTKHLREIYEEPVYGLGILPSEDEGGRAALNAARSLRSFTEAASNLILFDNAAWRGGSDSIESGYDRTNREMVTRLATLLSAGEVDGSTLSENAMDASDIRRTLATGGVSSIAYAEARLEAETRRQQGLLGSLRSNQAGNGADGATKVSGLIRQAVQSRLTCSADVSSVERSLIVLSGPPGEFSRKGLESGRRWLEEETGSVEVLAGDDPRRNADRLSVAILLSNPTRVPRLEQIQQQAVAAQDRIEEQSRDRDQAIRTLITDDGDRLDPL